MWNSTRSGTSLCNEEAGEDGEGVLPQNGMKPALEVQYPLPEANLREEEQSPPSSSLPPSALPRIVALFHRLVREGPLPLQEAASYLFHTPGFSPLSGALAERILTQLLTRYPRFHCEDGWVHPYKPFWYEEPWAVLDLETTGMKPEQGAEIVEMAVYQVQGSSLLARFVTLVKPSSPLPSWIPRFNGITDALVANAPGISLVYPRLQEFLGGLPWLAHNLRFDFRFLQHAAQKLSMPLPGGERLCSLKLARRLLPARSYSLANLSRELYLPYPPAHRAEADVRATWQLLLYLFLLLPREVEGFQELRQWLRKKGKKKPFQGEGGGKEGLIESQYAPA